MRISIVFLLTIITGCNAPEGSQRERFVPNRPVTSIITDTVTGTVEGAWEAVQMPFEDLNLKRQEIPEKLQWVSDHPYTLPPQMLCKDIRKEIAELDILLGPDVCTQDNPTGEASISAPQTANPFICTPDAPFGMVSRKGEYIEQGAGMAKNRVVGIVSDKVNIIPFRGIVRKITGAEKHAKEVEKAYQAGKLRRAFLKGLIISGNCRNIMLPHNMTPAPIIAVPEPEDSLPEDN